MQPLHIIRDKKEYRNMDRDKTKITVARCGFACEACMFSPPSPCTASLFLIYLNAWI
jgi:hypothetical protein